MGYENDPFMDEDGEPLMDPDAQSDREVSPGPRFADDDFDDEEVWRRSRSPTPVMDEGKGGKPRKRLVKKGAKDATPSPARSASPGNALDDWDEEEEEEEEQAPSSKKGGKGYDLLKVGMAKGESSKKEKKEKNKKRKDRPSSSSREADRGGKGWSASGSRGRDQGADPEMKELWDTIAGDSEDDQEGVRTMDDDNFIDDTGVDPAERYGSDNEGSAGNAPQAEEGEEDDEINKLFKGGKKKKKAERNPAEIALIVEQCMAELEVIAEEDAELNRQGKPAINKLKKLPMLIDVLSKKTLQTHFLDHGVLALLKNWLEPLPDGSLPNMNIRSAILNILTDFPIDLHDEGRRMQLKKSGLGKVIMFLSKSDEETTANRKLAKELVDKWSRPIFNKSTRFEDMRSYDDDRVPYRRPPVKKPANKSSGLNSREDDVDEFSQGPKSGQGASRQHASRPEATPLDFVVRPQSKIDPDEIRARAKNQVQDQRRLKMNKKLQQLKAPKKKQLQASKLSVEGRGMVKYL